MTSLFSAGPAVGYKNVRLVEDRNVDLHIYHSRGKGLWNNDVWLEEGRPRELSSLNLATWNLLTTSVREYQTGLRRAYAKMVLRLLLPVYLVYLFMIIFLDSSQGISFTESEPGLVILFWGGFTAYMIGAVIWVRCYHNNYAQQVFHPAIELVLEELQQPLLDAGYQVDYIIVDDRNACPKISKGFLRFTPLPDQEAGKDAQGQRGQLKWQPPEPVAALE